MTNSHYGDVLKRIEVQVGGLVEIWLNDASIETWVEVVRVLDAAGYDTSVARNGRKEAVSIHSTMFYSDESEDSYSLQVAVGRQLWTSPLQSVETVEFQGDPESIRTDDDLDDIHNFMKELARASQRTVIFMPETMRAEAVTKYLVVEP